MGGGCGPELPVALHSFPAALPREGSCRAFQQWLLGCAEPQIPAVCSSSCHPSPLDSPGDQVDSLKHLLPKDSSMAVPQAALLAWYNFWSLGLLATWYARKFTFHFSTLFLLLLSCCIYSRWKPDVILIRELPFLKGNIHQGRSRRCSFAVNYLNSSLFFFLLNRKSKKMYLKAIVLWLQNKSHLP